MSVFDEELKKRVPREELVEEVPVESEKIGPTQFYDLVTGRQPDWQTIIYDLIHTEQLDPWDIDLVVLTSRYFEKIYELEEKATNDGIEMDFYISSKVLLAAALLLRIKSEFLLNKHIRSIDAVLFGRKEELKPVVGRIEIDEDELPLLIPKTPLPRLRQVTLDELMTALNKAISTETRRIKREVAVRRAKKLSEVDFPSFRRVDLKDRIRQFYAKILTSVRKKAVEADKHLNKVGYTELTGADRAEKLACFLPILHLSNTKKVWVEQEKHLEEIWIYLYEFFKKNSDKFMEELEEDIEDMKVELEGGENLDEKKSALEKAREKREAKKRLQEEIKKELEEELNADLSGIIKEEKIDEITGFSNEQ